MSEPEIIFENADFMVVNKPSGLMVHATKYTGERTLVDWLVERYPEIKTVGDDPALRPGIVHRLDKETSGIMLVARTQESFEKLKLLFQEHKMKKTYLAFVSGIPKKEQGVIDAPIGIKNGTLKRSIHSLKMAKPAITEYTVLEKHTIEDEHGKEKQFSLIEARPKTGRTHQIRVHLASLGNPIVGDPLYAGKKPFPSAPRLMLHAAALSFSDERGNQFQFEAAPPTSFTDIVSYPQNLFGPHFTQQ